MRIWLVFIIILFFETVKSQDVKITKEEAELRLSKTNAFYESGQSYSIKTKIKAYESCDSQVVIESSEGEMQRFGSCFWSVVMGVRTIQNENMTVVIDTLQKIVVLGNPDPVSETQDQIKQWLAVAKEIYVNSEHGSNHYTILFSKDFIYNRVEFTTNTEGYVSSSKVCYDTDDYDENGLLRHLSPRIETVFTYSKLNFIDRAMCDVSKYVSTDAGILKLTEAYSDFELMDTRVK